MLQIYGCAIWLLNPWTAWHRCRFKMGITRRGASDFDRLAELQFSIDAPARALDAWGWSSVCAALNGTGEAGDWQRILDHPHWTGTGILGRSSKGVSWAGLLLQAGALPSFDRLGQMALGDPARRALQVRSTPCSNRNGPCSGPKAHERHSAAQALAASHQAELAARIVPDREAREAVLAEALRLRAGILAGTGAYGPAYFALREADSLAVAQGRAERARNGVFESEPWLSAIGDARTRMETAHMQRWRKASVVLGALGPRRFGLCPAGFPPAQSRCDSGCANSSNTGSRDGSTRFKSWPCPGPSLPRRLLAKA